MAFPVPPGLDGLRPLHGTFPAQRGQQTPGDSPLAPRQTAHLIKLENGCIEGECVAIHVGISAPPRVLPQTRIRLTDKLPLPRARATWGIGNARQFVDFDVGAGAALSVPIESLQVAVRYDVAIPPWTEEDPCDLSCMPLYEVSATVGYGGVAAYLTYTEVAFMLDAIDGTKGRALVPVPPFAKSMTVLPSGNAPVAVHLRFPASVYDVENVIAVPLSNAGQSNRIDQLPVLNSERWIEVENTGSAERATAFVVFGISV